MRAAETRVLEKFLVTEGFRPRPAGSTGPSIVASLVTGAFMAVLAVGVRLLLGEHL